MRETKEKAMKDNEEKARESGNRLTQTINRQGELVSVKDMNTTERGLVGEGSDTVATADIRQELFDGDNVVIDHKKSDHGVSQLTNAPPGLSEVILASKSGEKDVVVEAQGAEEQTPEGDESSDES